MRGAKVVIRGEVYLSAKAAAKAFGISPKSVSNAIRRGRQDFIGIPAHKTRTKHGVEPFQVRIRGEVFASVRDASERFGVEETTIRVALICGREDFIGLGRSRKHCTAGKGRTPANARPVTIGPHKFRSIVQCAAALGVATSTLRDRLDANDAVWLMARAMAFTAQTEGHKPASNKTLTKAARAGTVKARNRKGQADK